MCRWGHADFKKFCPCQGQAQRFCCEGDCIKLPQFLILYGRAGPRAKRQGSTSRGVEFPIMPLRRNEWIENISFSEVVGRIKLDNEMKSFLKTGKELPKNYYSNTDKYLGVFHTCFLPTLCKELVICYSKPCQISWKLAVTYLLQVRKLTPRKCKALDQAHSL